MLNELIGGVLGFYCGHEYAHTDISAKDRLPFALRGVDVAIYTVFRALGLSIDVRPILVDERFSYDFLDENCYLVGKEFHKRRLATTGAYYDDNDWDKTMDDEWPHERISDIVWVNHPEYGELAWARPVVSLR